MNDDVLDREWSLVPALLAALDGLVVGTLVGLGLGLSTDLVEAFLYVAVVGCAIASFVAGRAAVRSVLIHRSMRPAAVVVLVALNLTAFALFAAGLDRMDLQ